MVLLKLGFEEEKGVIVEFLIKDKNILAFITFDLIKGGASELSKMGITARLSNHCFHQPPKYQIREDQ